MTNRQIAKAAGLIRYTNSKPCKNSHTNSAKYVSSGGCVECSTLRILKNKNSKKLYDAEYRIKHISQKKITDRQYRVKNKNNLGFKIKELARCKWSKFLRKQRTPLWANKEKIAEFYKEAHRLTLETSILHHVDHILPLNGKEVSGFHVRVIPYYENLSKSNKLIENLL
jgi:hypothetical protein